MEFLNMSNRELERHAILVKVKSKALTQLKAAELLNLSTRQVRNLLKRFEILGPQGLVSYKRGKTSNRQTHPEIKSFVLKLINDRYSDFGPTLITENLKERYGITLSRETLRKWMSVAHFWVPHQRKKNYHPLRKRKDFFGEMIQADGSHHDWFEIGHFCNLFVFIDDATGKITSA
jgi:transposase